MGEFGRILTNLGLAYGLMSKDQFVEKVAQYAQEKDLSEEKMMALVENLFEEIEITYRRRQASQMYEAYKMKRTAGDSKSNDVFTEFERNESSGFADIEMLDEMKKLRSAIEKLSDVLTKNEQSE